jgi:alanyl-tRNA synthetase
LRYLAGMLRPAAGLHCENTEDVGLIKIISSERIQDGVERITFVAGPAALGLAGNIPDTDKSL